MPDPMTPDLDAIRERWAAATPGPWKAHDTDLVHGGHTATVLRDIPIPERQDLPGRGLIAWLPSGSNEPWDEARNVWHNSVAIAAAPSDVAALMAWGEHLAAEVERLRAENAELRGRVSLAADDLESINVAYEVGYANGRRDTQGGDK